MLKAVLPAAVGPATMISFLATIIDYNHSSKNSRTQPAPPFLESTMSEMDLTAFIASAGQADSPTAFMISMSLISSPTKATSSGFMFKSTHQRPNTSVLLSCPT